MEERLICRNLVKTYGTGPFIQTVLDGITLELYAGQMCAIMGPSGSGKTTLLSIIGCMLSPTSGSVDLAGRQVNYQSLHGLVELRRRYIGFVFQHAQLLPFFTLHENLRVVALNSGVDRHFVDDRIREVSRRLGIHDILHKKPAQCSGGQRQRVAIARAVLHRPPVLLADEPTAALDWENGEAAVQLLIEQAAIERSLLITVTHDQRLLPRFHRVLHIDRGKVFES